MSWYNNFVTNQRNSPAIIADILSNRPTKAALGALFVSTDTLELDRFNGSNWDQISGNGTGVSTIYITATDTNVITDARMIGVSIKIVLRGGIGSGEVITTGVPIGEQLLFNSGAGSLTAASNFGSGELLTIMLQ